jgi:hypothetical protein
VEVSVSVGLDKVLAGASVCVAPICVGFSNLPASAHALEEITSVKVRINPANLSGFIVRGCLQSKNYWAALALLPEV